MLSITHLLPSFLPPSLPPSLSHPLTLSPSGMLAGGTSVGNVVMWRWKGAPSSSSSSSSSSFSPGGSSEGPNRWEYLTSSVVAGPVKEVKVQGKGRREGGGGYLPGSLQTCKYYTPLASDT